MPTIIRAIERLKYISENKINDKNKQKQVKNCFKLKPFFKYTGYELYHKISLMFDIIF